MLDCKFFLRDQYVVTETRGRLLALPDGHREFVGARRILHIDADQSQVTGRLSGAVFAEKWNRPIQNRALDLRRLFRERHLHHKYLALPSAELPVDPFRGRWGIRKQLD